MFASSVSSPSKEEQQADDDDSIDEFGRRRPPPAAPPAEAGWPPNFEKHGSEYVLDNRSGMVSLEFLCFKCDVDALLANSDFFFADENSSFTNPNPSSFMTPRRSCTTAMKNRRTFVILSPTMETQYLKR